MRTAKPLHGQVALVTGAARRIGRSIVHRLADEGAAVVINYATSRQAAEALVAELVAAGCRALACQADVSRRADVERMFDLVHRELGQLNILVNNAGIFFPARFDELTEEQWDRIHAVNLKAQFLCAQAAARLMRHSGRGRIVNIASLGGLLPWPEYTHYCTSKAGVIMLTRCLARALAPEITVNCVAPGTIQFPDEAPDAEYIRRAPLQKTGRGEDIAEAVFYLVQAEFVTGQVLVVDGGRSLV